MRLHLVLLPVLLFLTLWFALNSGQYSLSLLDISRTLVHWWNGEVFDNKDIVFFNIRLPRILTAISVGIGLSVAGAVYQGMFKNPLVSPDILGVTAGAGLGAVSAIYCGLSLFGIQLFAFMGGLMAVSLVYVIANSVRKQHPILALVLSGIAISALLGAGISLLKIMADPYAQLSTITFWLMGGLNMATFNELAFVFPLILTALLPLWLLRWRMNVLSLEDEEAKTLGINLSRTRLIFILSATLMTSAVVSVTGIIGWVGLIIPHIARLWLSKIGKGSADFRLLMPVTACLGASFLLLTDTIARSWFRIEIPLGVITSFVGAPFFLGLLLKGK